MVSIVGSKEDQIDAAFDTLTARYMLFNGKASRIVSSRNFAGEYFHLWRRPFGFLNNALSGFTTIKVLLLFSSTTTGTLVSEGLFNWEKKYLIGVVCRTCGNIV